MPRSKKFEPEQVGDLLAQGAMGGISAKEAVRPAASTENSRLREYMAEDGLMKVERFDLLSAEFASPGSAFDDQRLPEFHKVMAIHTRGWMILRRLFGICLVIPDESCSPDDLRTWSREELMASLGVTAAQLKEELDRLRGIWSAQVQVAPPNAASPQGTDTPVPKGGQVPLVFEQEQAVERVQMLDLLTKDEIPWMASRIEACSLALNNPQVGELARMSLLTELDIRRLYELRAKSSKRLREEGNADTRLALGNEYTRLTKQINELMENYNAQLKHIDELMPGFMVQARGAISMKGVFSDAIAVHAEFMRHPENRPVDGVFTVGEIEVLMRMSVQAAEPQYRLGQVVYLNQARANLFNAEWSGAFLPNTLKKLDAGFRVAAMEIANGDGETLTDLLATGRDGEYPEIKKAG